MREMGPHLIVIRSVSLQDIVQVQLAEHDEVVERFATYRSDERHPQPMLRGESPYIPVRSASLLERRGFEPSLFVVPDGKRLQGPVAGLSPG
jgi:hypothetical protein